MRSRQEASPFGHGELHISSESLRENPLERKLRRLQTSEELQAHPLNSNLGLLGQHFVHNALSIKEGSAEPEPGSSPILQRLQGSFLFSLRLKMTKRVYTECTQSLEMPSAQRAPSAAIFCHDQLQATHHVRFKTVSRLPAADTRNH